MKITLTNGKGYIWYSDQNKPEIINTLDYDFQEGENPFVVECMFSNDKESYIIRYIDGKYIISHATDLTPHEGDQEIEYIAHRLNNIESLQFIQRWNSKINHNCMDMEQLEPAQLIFKGFKTTK